MTKHEVIERYPDDDLLFADGYDDCIIGIDARDNRVIYNVEKCVKKLMKDSKMELGDALDYLYFNTILAWVGDKTPIWCEP
jgi:hypothetical protein